MGNHHVVLAQDRGGMLTRAFHFVKTEAFHWLGVVIKNLFTQEIFEYDAYHDQLENGRYVLLFIDENGDRKGTMELEITDQSPDEIFIVYKWSEFASFLSTETVSKEQFDEMASGNRLMTPKGYRGY